VAEISTIMAKKKDGYKEPASDAAVEGRRQRKTKRNLPAEKYPYLLLRFYDTYTYYIYT